jgi:phosphoribosylamine--glycine ligase
MGGCTWPSYASVDLLDEVEPVLRAIEGMAAEGTPYRGVLYAGLMLTADGVRVLSSTAASRPGARIDLPLLGAAVRDVPGGGAGR